MSTNNVINITIVLLYLAAMIGFGFWGKRRTRDKADFLVAGRHLGPLLYTGTMAAVVLGGASTVGGVGLGYTAGLSGLWLVAAIGTGVLLLSLIFASRLQRLRIYTVSQMLQLRYGHRATQASSLSSCSAIPWCSAPPPPVPMPRSSSYSSAGNAGWRLW